MQGGGNAESGVVDASTRMSYVLRVRPSESQDPTVIESFVPRRVPMLFNPRDVPSAELEAEILRLCALITDLQMLQLGLGAGELASRDVPILDRWALFERAAPCLIGLSTGHPKLHGKDRLMSTSDLRLLAEDGSYARTLSRWYRLGRPAPHSASNA